MEQQLRALRRRIVRTARDARGYRRYDEQLRIELVEYVLRRRDDGCCQAEVARELGLMQRTIWGWMQQAQQDVSSQSGYRLGRSLLEHYCELGAYISRKLATAEWGDGVVEDLAANLAGRYLGAKGYTRRG